MTINLEFHSLAQSPFDSEEARTFVGRHWPRFLLEGDVSSGLAGRLPADFPDYQLLAVDGTGELAAVALSIPVAVGAEELLQLDGGWDSAIEIACSDADHDRPPSTLVAVSITIRSDLRSAGAGRAAILAMKKLALRHGLRSLLAPVRPAGKHEYPLLAMEDYLGMTRSDGARLDAWVRSHEELGGTLVAVTGQSMSVVEPLAVWSEWTGLEFPVSGPYVIDAGLVPLLVDVDTGTGTYVEPNVWVQHEVVLAS